MTAQQPSLPDPGLKLTPSYRCTPAAARDVIDADHSHRLLGAPHEQPSYPRLGHQWLGCACICDRQTPARSASCSIPTRASDATAGEDLLRSGRAAIVSIWASGCGIARGDPQVRWLSRL